MVSRGVVCLAPLLAVAVAAGDAHAQSTCTEAETVVIRGDVQRGETFERPISSELLVRLRPHDGLDDRGPEPPSARSRALLPRVTTYRFSNARCIRTGYGFNARGAVRRSERAFEVLLHDADVETTAGAGGVLLWSENHDADEIAAARDWLSTVPRGSGLLRIVSSQLAEDGSPGDRGAILSMEFEVEPCLAPAAPTPRPRDS